MGPSHLEKVHTGREDDMGKMTDQLEIQFVLANLMRNGMIQKVIHYRRAASAAGACSLLN